MRGAFAVLVILLTAILMLLEGVDEGRQSSSSLTVLLLSRLGALSLSLRYDRFRLTGRIIRKSYPASPEIRNRVFSRTNCSLRTNVKLEESLFTGTLCCNGPEPLKHTLRRISMSCCRATCNPQPEYLARICKRVVLESRCRDIENRRFELRRLAKRECPIEILPTIQSEGIQSCHSREIGLRHFFQSIRVFAGKPAVS